LDEKIRTSANEACVLQNQGLPDELRRKSLMHVYVCLIFL